MRALSEPLGAGKHADAPMPTGPGAERTSEKFRILNVKKKDLATMAWHTGRL